MRTIASLFGMALVLVGSSTAFADDVAGSYDVKYEEVSTNCPSPLKYQHGKLEVKTKGTSVTVDYLDSLGNARSSDIAVVRQDGTFTAHITATDPLNLPGRHTIRASDGTQTATTTYTAR